jgi:hypothetical protein
VFGKRRLIDAALKVELACSEGTRGILGVVPRCKGGHGSYAHDQAAGQYCCELAPTTTTIVSAGAAAHVNAFPEVPSLLDK